MANKNLTIYDIRYSFPHALPAAFRAITHPLQTQLPTPDPPALDETSPPTPHTLTLTFTTLDNPAIRRYRLMARRTDADARPPNVALGCLPNGEPADAFEELAVYECGAKYRPGRTRAHCYAAEGLAAGRDYGFLVLAEAEHAAACRSRRAAAVAAAATILPLPLRRTPLRLLIFRRRRHSPLRVRARDGARVAAAARPGSPRRAPCRGGPGRRRS